VEEGREEEELGLGLEAAGRELEEELGVVRTTGAGAEGRDGVEEKLLAAGRLEDEGDELEVEGR